MRDEAAVAGRYELAGTTASFPRLQLVTVEDLLADRLPVLPRAGRIAAMKEAQALRQDEQGKLFEE